MHVQPPGYPGFGASQHTHALFVGLAVVNIGGVFHYQDSVFTGTSLKGTLLMH